MYNINEIGVILNITSLLWLCLMLLTIKNREHISSLINKGMVCPSCKEDFEIKTYEDYENLNGRRLCIECKRDEILRSFLNRKKKLIDFTKYKKAWIVFTCINVVSVILNVIGIFSKTYRPELSFISGSMIFTSNMFNYIQYRQTTRKKRKTQS